MQNNPNTPDDSLVSKINVEFPEYCIMDGRHMAQIKIASTMGYTTSRNACVGCGIPTCFGNSQYEKSLTERQEEAVNQWRMYLSEQK